ncbi:uncharacterized protein SAPINGB_P002491 [Magnusiomyces paraingens]|uniref:Cns1/TTC4 wheel domain-containing protein n=1 Tax=Magnusiomyces paraingens TaxID=2606893 RepID=A0A5E8BE71_9ASCO|nr:uncharacterized protein SAPINGB_P002491 [Saprochaete ingens]VVT49883.1 unnamed protein product [Saprochaete ingens]
MSSKEKEWIPPQRYVPGPGMPALPPQLYQDSNKTVDEVAEELKKMPFFMTELDDVDENDENSRNQIEALKALAYEGEPEEVAANFKAQGNEQYKLKRYKDAVEFYTKAINVEWLGEKGEDPEEGRKIKMACFSNRAACNLELKNYRQCINDCKIVLTQFEPAHEKSLFRAGKAYLGVDRADEGMQLLQYGVEVVPDSKTLPGLLQTLTTRHNTKLELERKRREAEELKQTKKRNLEASIAAHKFTLLKSANTEDDSSSPLPSDVRIHLEDDLNPASTLIVPVMFLYPVDMQSDIIQQADVDSTTINEYLQQLFGDELPPWVCEDNKNVSDYSNIKTLEVYAQTDSGGLVKVGKASTLAKVFSLEKPVVPIIDSVPRLYVVPKNKAKEWLSNWNKDHARYLLYGE